MATANYLFNSRSFMKYLFSLVLLSLVVVTAQAQQRPMTQATQRPAVAHEAPKGDTAKLKAAFKELYPLIRPTPSIKERTEQALHRMDRMFKMQGVDSAKAWDSVMKAINPSQDEEILYNVYSENFTPEELKSLATFFKTPTGKHYLEVDQRLSAAHQQTEQYIMRTINMVTAPMRKPTERRPPGAPGAPNVPGAPGRPHPGMHPGQGQPPVQPPVQPTPAPEPQH
jgi:hypothetical protein